MGASNTSNFWEVNFSFIVYSEWPVICFVEIEKAFSFRLSSSPPCFKQLLVKIFMKI